MVLLVNDNKRSDDGMRTNAVVSKVKKSGKNVVVVSAGKRSKKESKG